MSVSLLPSGTSLLYNSLPSVLPSWFPRTPGWSKEGPTTGSTPGPLSQTYVWWVCSSGSSPLACYAILAGSDAPTLPLGASCLFQTFTAVGSTTHDCDSGDHWLLVVFYSLFSLFLSNSQKEKGEWPISYRLVRPTEPSSLSSVTPVPHYQWVIMFYLPA
jgi:hypothetical protein